MDMAEEGERSEQIKPGRLVLDIGVMAEPVVRLGGEIVVDARKKNREGELDPKGMINPDQWNKLGELVGAVRYAYVSGRNRNDALFEAAHQLNIPAKEVEIIGEIPEYWRPTDEMGVRICHRWLKEWESAHSFS